jgi:putative oxidoreductase
MNTRLETAELLTHSAPSRSLAARAIHALVATRNGAAPAVLRLALGLVMFPHGAQKLLGWFGGHGFSATVAGMSQMLPTALVVLVIVIEFFGSLALILGAFSRAAALGIAAVMAGAVATVHVSNGFFMNWMGTQAGEGYEFHLLAIGIALAIMITGGGSFSVDRWLSRPVARATR